MHCICKWNTYIWIWMTYLLCIMEVNTTNKMNYSELICMIVDLCYCHRKVIKNIAKSINSWSMGFICYYFIYIILVDYYYFIIFKLDLSIIIMDSMYYIIVNRLMMDQIVWQSDFVKYILILYSLLFCFV